MIIQAAIIAAVCGILSGFIEACVQEYRTEVHDYRKLNHAHLTILRALVLGPVAFHIAGGVTIAAAITLLFMATVFAPVHRAVKNAASRVPNTYMGPTIRGPKDSWYDTQWMSLAAYRIESWLDKKTGAMHTRYHLYADALPFILCTLFESSVAVAVGYYITTL